MTPDIIEKIEKIRESIRKINWDYVNIDSDVKECLFNYPAIPVTKEVFEASILKTLKQYLIQTYPPAK